MQTFCFWGLCWDTVHMSVSDKLVDIQQLGFSLLQTQAVTVYQVMSVLGKANFCANGHSQLWWLCCVSQIDLLTVYHSPVQLLSSVHFSFLALHQLEWLSHWQQSSVPLQFPLPDVVIATDVMASNWAFYFQGSGLPLSVTGSWSSSMCRAHIALQKLLAVAMILHRMVFWLSSKVFALHFDNNTAKAYLCKQGGRVSPFLSRLACHILSVTDKCSNTLSKINSYQSECGHWLSVMGSTAFRVASSSHCPIGFWPLGSVRGGSDGIL